jgi:flagellar hook assembly protein FlgD
VARASGFIGRDIEYDLSEAGMTDAPARWRWESGVEVAAYVATVTDAAGNALHRETIVAEADSGTFSWDGRLSDGGRAPPGSYSLSVDGLSANGATVPVSAFGTGRVTEVLSESGEVSLVAGGVRLPASALRRIADGS